MQKPVKQDPFCSAVDPAGHEGAIAAQSLVHDPAVTA